jgi:hypothetical protein
LVWKKIREKLKGSRLQISFSEIGGLRGREEFIGVRSQQSTGRVYRGQVSIINRTCQVLRPVPLGYVGDGSPGAAPEWGGADTGKDPEKAKGT